MPAKWRQLWPFLLLVVVCLLLFTVNRPLFLLLNNLNTPWLDPVFLSITHLGNGAVAGMLVLLLFPVRKDMAVKTALAALAGGIIAAVFKEVIAAPRPPAVFGTHIHILGKKMVGHSLPSGHTATAFGLAFGLKGLVSRRTYAASLAAACLVGYSRIYIGAHFPLDVVLGAAAGWTGARLTVRPSDRLLARMHGDSVSVTLPLLALAFTAGTWVALYEPMLPYNPVVLRLIGFGGAAAAAILAFRTLAAGKRS
jgi:membrane-associated phospholipid phosphatase